MKQKKKEWCKTVSYVTLRYSFKCNELFSVSTFKIMMHRNYESSDNIGNIYKKLVFELIIWALNITKNSLVGMYNLYTYDKFYILWKSIWQISFLIKYFRVDYHSLNVRCS